MTDAKTRTCHWCGITKPTASREHAWLCTACRSIDKKTVVNDGVALPDGHWINVKGVQKFVVFEHPTVPYCGTHAGYDQHRAHGEWPCPACRVAEDLYQARVSQLRTMASIIVRNHRVAV